MARIVVNPDELRNLARFMRGSLSALEAGQMRLNSAVLRMDWEVKARYPVEAEWYAVRGKAWAALQQGFYLASSLDYKAERFEWADRSGQGGLPVGIDRFFHYGPYILPGILQKLLEMRREMLGPCPFPFDIGPLGIVVLGLYHSLKEDRETRSGLLSLCFEALEVLAPGISSLPVLGFVSSTFLDFAESGDLSERSLRMAICKNGVEAVVALNPYGGAALAVSAAVQVGGNVWIRGTEAWGKALCVEPMHDAMIEESADRAHRALSKLDLGNITGDLGKILNDAYLEPQVDAWRKAFEHPSAENFASAAFTSATFLANPAYAGFKAYMNPRTRSLIFEDVRSLGFHVMDFSVGVFEAPIQLVRHQVVTEGAILTERVGSMLPPGLRERVVSQCDDYLKAINDPRWELPTMEKAFADYEEAIGGMP